jgi:hypothetical protein
MLRTLPASAMSISPMCILWRSVTARTSLP